MQKKRVSEQGFSLVELIGVLAVIAILAAMVAPKVFDVIEDAKVSTLVDNVKQLTTASSKFYKDTGLRPTHNPADASGANHQLIRNDAKINNWKGPYLDEEMQSPFTSTTSYYLMSGAEAFDIDGDGTNDYVNAIYVAVDGLNADQAMAVSNSIDNDAAGKWYAAGKVRTRKSIAPVAGALGSVAAGTDILIMLSGY
ncbi:MAG: hypothetical protein AUK35_05110 [Zetaproteobacteria bacterium CG2_30_46_52]|nr:MAG: hypothetical protein AUK35_05110 [Zetaproteobacteria bacterium CG2_30_46_52]